AMIARSTGPGISLTDGYAGIDETTFALGLTGYTGPLKPVVIRFCKTRYPMLPGRREAPITATERGRKNGSSEAWVAMRSRCSAIATLRSVGSISKAI